ncbi:DMT family transporter [Tropicimonas marinistellae]|uniref:DMT family transporter n=1 Tax=Tropicimonas marinistellae TaxID=1739787 RepID=UPI00082B0253|nr:DMT family transporter [Tropicimonas marinistellae]
MHPTRAILLKLGSVVVFVTMQSLIKATSDHVPPGEAVFFRSAFALPVILLWLSADGRLAAGLRTRRPGAHLLRGLVGTAAMGFGFAALGLLPLPEVSAIGYAAPLFVVPLAIVFLGEKVGPVRLSAVAMGLVGVLIILSPRLTAFSGGGIGGGAALGALFALCSALLAAFAQILIRGLVATERPVTVVLYFTLSSTLLSLLTIPFGWVWPEPREAALLVLAGLAGGLGQAMLTTAYRMGDASLLAPFDYASMLIALLVGYFVFAELPTWQMLFGAALVIAAGILIIWREGRLAAKAPPSRAQAVTPTAGRPAPRRFLPKPRRPRG